MSTKKNDCLQAIQDYDAYLTTKFGSGLKVIRTDNGGEFKSEAFESWTRRKGITHHFTSVYTPEQNPEGERMNRTLVECGRCLKHPFNTPDMFWGESILTAAYIRNRCPTSRHPSKTPHELFHSVKPDISHLRTFGCPAFVHIDSKIRTKWDSKAIEGIFVGYGINVKGYRIYIPTTGKVITTLVYTLNSMNHSATPLTMNLPSSITPLTPTSLTMILYLKIVMKMIK